MKVVKLVYDFFGIVFFHQAALQEDCSADKNWANHMNLAVRECSLCIRRRGGHFWGS